MNRPSALFVLASALFVVACDARPFASFGGVTVDGALRLNLSGIPKMAKVNVCDKDIESLADVQVPIDCVAPDDMPLDYGKDIESKPIPIVVKPLVGSSKRFDKTLTLKSIDQRQILEGVLGAVTRGGKLGDAKKGGDKPGVAVMGYGGVRAFDAKTLSDVDVVVRVSLVNKRDAGRSCAYSGAVTGKLQAYDADLEAFDAHTGKSIAKTRLTNDNPACPSESYAKTGETVGVTSRPPDSKIDQWIRSTVK